MLVRLLRRCATRNDSGLRGEWFLLARDAQGVASGEAALAARPARRGLAAAVGKPSHLRCAPVTATLYHGCGQWREEGKPCGGWGVGEGNIEC